MRLFLPMSDATIPISLLLQEFFKKSEGYVWHSCIIFAVVRCYHNARYVVTSFMLCVFNSSNSY